MRSFWEERTRREIFARIGRLTPEAPPRWGRMSAPRMVAHLSDQMRHTLGDEPPPKPRPGPLRWAPLRWLSIYWAPWRRGRLRGPPEAFVTEPGEWEADVERLVQMVRRFAERDPEAEWPDHFLFGRMRGKDWGAFCFRHFDHHLKQFGV